MEAEVNQIKNISGGKNSLEEAIVSLQGKLDTLNMQFPDREEIILRELSSLLARLNIEVVSFRPQRKSIVTEIENSPIAVKGCSIQEMSMAISVKTAYKKLIEFFKILKRDFPIYLRVESIRMQKKSADKSSALLNADLALDAYLISRGEKE